MLLTFRSVTLLVLVAVSAAVACGGPGGSTDHEPAVSESDRRLQQEWDAWYERQVAQDCIPGPYDEDALAAVRRAHAGDSRQFVYGPTDPYNRRTASLQNLKTRSNPNGEGTLVTAWEDSNRQGSADYSRRRSAWLVLDGDVYPINRNASGDIGRLYDGIPNGVQRRAGLTLSYERGRTTMDQLGLEDQTFERRFSGGNPFPTCR